MKRMIWEFTKKISAEFLRHSRRRKKIKNLRGDIIQILKGEWFKNLREEWLKNLHGEIFQNLSRLYHISSWICNIWEQQLLKY